MIANVAKELFSSSLNVISFDESYIKEAKTRFLQFQDAGVIKENCSFGDKVWYTTDEYSNVGLHFSFNKVSYKQYEPVFKLAFEEFILYIKAFLISAFGKNALVTMRTVLLDLRHIIGANIDTVFGASDEMRIALPSICSDFFSMLPGAEDSEDVERLINAMEIYADINLGSQKRRQRQLADFDTYFRFDDLIKDYWRQSLKTEERLFYYPLYMWWMITGVIPLRPREFLLTERNCLSRGDDGSYYLRLRRNQLKGGHRGVTYKLADDYVVDRYKIPAYLGEEIQRYLDLTAEYEDTEIKTLFVTDPHYRKWEQSKHSNSRYLTYMNMNTILRYFYKDVITGRYGLSVVFGHPDRHLADDEIGYIHLGDTRHIALINLMQEGGTPVTAMLLAGHNNAITASHYYSNLTELIECKTYRQYRRLSGDSARFQISFTPRLPTTAESKVLSDGGRCYSKAYLQGEIDDCLATMGENGEIGYCPACTYYRKAGANYASDDIYKRNLKQDCVALKRAVDMVRQGKGGVEDIGEALLRLRSSSVSYEKYLLEKQNNRE